MNERIAQMKRLEGEKRMSKVSMKGVIDMHVHTNPDLRLRAYDDFEMMEAGIRVGARAIVLKTHQGTTMDRAYLCNRHNEIVHGKTNNFTMFGSITLNKVVGGINPKAVDVALKLGAKVVWLPTQSARNHMVKNNLDPAGCVDVVRDGKVVPELNDVFGLIRDHNAVLGTAHVSPEEAFRTARTYMDKKEPMSIAFHGNIVDLLEYAVNNNIHIDLLSDQTSCHVPYDGGYCPQGLTFEERTEMLDHDHEKFCELVNRSLTTHFHMIRTLVERGSYFFDYGNAFMKAVFDAGNKEISKNGVDTSEGFIFPSYVEDILGPELFDYGYGPFRWCCLSGKHEDLIKTDHAAMEIIDPNRRFQDRDNWIWIRDAEKNQLVVGTQCRILYQDALGRRDIALKFNEMVRNGEIGPVMLGRDHHDTGGTDSPYRETSNIYDGSNFTADMATHCYAGNAARGMTLVALHNGGGTGIGKAINGGFGLVL